ncbi:hypothetical protein GJ496_006479 [Pomphorhynchus laevis]|nr:hypothetical protein GJ496_006479 [Pomphorhynchus laevis]
MDKRTISYQTSETRLTEVLDSLCARILEYNVHAERSGSNRYAKGRSQTMDSLWGLRNRGVKVVLDVPDDMWDHPSAEITNLEKSCNYMLEEYEDAIRDWYFSKNEEPLTKYLCEDRVLLEQNTSCLYEVYVPSLNDDENGSKNEENTNSDVEDDEVDDSGEVIKKNEAGDDDESVESNESSDKQYENAHRHEDL